MFARSRISSIFSFSHRMLTCCTVSFVLTQVALYPLYAHYCLYFAVALLASNTDLQF